MERVIKFGMSVGTGERINEMEDNSPSDDEDDEQ